MSRKIGVSMLLASRARVYITLALLSLSACSGPAGSEPAPCDRSAETAAWLAAVPAACFDHLGKEYLGDAVGCIPGEAPTCALDFGQRQTPLDGTGNAVTFLCNCASSGLYSCLYVGGQCVAQSCVEK